MQFYSLKSQEVQKTIPELLFLKTIPEFQGNLTDSLISKMSTT